MCFALSMLFLCGCGETGEKGTVLPCKEDLLSAEATVTAGDETFRVKWSFDENVTLEIITPESISGSAFVKDGKSDVFAIGGEMTIPLSKELSEGFIPYFEMYELRDENIVSISSGENGKTELKVKGECGVYTVFTDPSGNLTDVHFVGSREFKVTDFDCILKN